MKIAILLTTYNSEATIEEVITSLTAQQSGLSQIEALYIVDGGSTDRTLDIIRQGWKVPVPLKVLSCQTRLGEYYEVNAAMKQVPSEVDWVFRLHSDNPLKPHWLEVMLPLIASCPDKVATICSSWDNKNPDGWLSPGEDFLGKPPILVEGTKAAVRDTLLRGCWWHNCGCAIRMRAFQDIGEFDWRFRQNSDWEWLLRCLRQGWDVWYIPRTLFFYVQHGETQSNDNFIKNRDIHENVEVFGRYLPYASVGDVFRFFGRRYEFIIRRFGTRLLRLEPGKMGYALLSFGMLSLRLPQYFVCKIFPGST